jgi:hypothetical protein
VCKKRKRVRPMLIFAMAKAHDHSIVEMNQTLRILFISPRVAYCDAACFFFVKTAMPKEV